MERRNPLVEKLRENSFIHGVLKEGRTCLTKNSVLTDYLKVGLRVNGNGSRMKP